MHDESQRPAALHLHGVVLPEGVARDVFVVDGHVSFRRPDDADTVLEGGYMIPGLVDAHAHLGLASSAPHGAPAAERVRASARAHLAAGVLAIREPGGPDYASQGIGPHEGLPRVYTAGRFLAPPDCYFPGLAREVRPEDLADAAEQEAHASGWWAKVIGEWFGSDGRTHPNYSPAALSQAARRVHALGSRIAIHAISPEAIEGAIEARFDSIEHGWGLRDEHLEAMAERHIAPVPTLVIVPSVEEMLAEMSLTGPARREMLAAGRRHPEVTRRAAEAGVLVLAGTDAGMVPHGIIREEIRRLLDAGLPRETALAAGSWAARRFLGLPGIEEGAPADIVAYRDDPRADPEALGRPYVRVLDGRVVGPAKRTRESVPVGRRSLP